MEHLASQIGLLLISCLAGLLGAILGLGGGIFIVPVLTLFFGIDIRYAIGASIVTVIATSSGAAAAYIKERFTNVRLAILLEVATTIGALAGVACSSHVNKRFLFVFFGLMLFYSAFAMLMGRDQYDGVKQVEGSLSSRLRLNSSYCDPVLKREIQYSVSNVGLGLGLMWGAGLVSGLLGIGSGILKVPAMDRAMKLPIKVSSATSNFMIGVTAAASAGAYFMKGDVLPMLAGPVAIGALIGAWIGSRLMPRLPSQILRKAFVIILVIVSVQMALKGLRGPA
jgi:uncharacterized membrane protein YfcA